MNLSPRFISVREITVLPLPERKLFKLHSRAKEETFLKAFLLLNSNPTSAILRHFVPPSIRQLQIAQIQNQLFRRNVRIKRDRFRLEVRGRVDRRHTNFRRGQRRKEEERGGGRKEETRYEQCSKSNSGDSHLPRSSCTGYEVRESHREVGAKGLVALGTK